MSNTLTYRWTGVLRNVILFAFDFLERRITPVVIMDLDSTAFNNGPRTLAIIHEWLVLIGRTEDISTLKSQNLSVLPYDPVDILALVMPNLERDGIHKELVQEFLQFWKDRFFTNEYVQHDVPMPGVVDFLTFLHKLGVKIVYLTGRHLPGSDVYPNGMKDGTLASLTQHGFPLGEGTELVCKPQFTNVDHEFKVRYFASVRRLTESLVIAVFDNEPKIANLADAIIFGDCGDDDLCSILFVSNHAPNPPALYPSVEKIYTFLPKD